MPTVKRNEVPIAVCYLEKENDESNQCLLTEKNFIITRKGKTSAFLLNEITRLSLNSRKMMLPLVTGGIFAPLSILAISKNLFEPWAILTWLMLNLLLFYFGWVGYPVLTVAHYGIHQDFPIKRKGTNLKAFIRFSNEYISKLGKEPQVRPLYHILSDEAWKVAQKNQRYAPDSLTSEGFIHFSTKDQVPLVLERHFRNKSGLLKLHINPLKLKPQLKYEAVYEKEGLYPHLYGALNLDAVIKVEKIT